MSLVEPLHVNSEPRDGFYWIWGKAPDPSKPMTARPKIPIKIWTVVTVDEVGERIDVDRQYIKIGDELCTVSQEDWLFFAKHPITEEDYEALYITGAWK